MGIFGRVRQYQHKYRFQVRISDVERAAFSSCSELSAEVAKVEHWEGGHLIPSKEPGRTTFSDVTLERGVTFDRDLYNWFLEVVRANADMGRVMPRYARDVDILQIGRNKAVVRRWALINAWPVKFVAGEWSGDDDGVVIESVTLTYDLFKRSND